MASPQGLYKKYAVTRLDGGSNLRQKHQACRYFVIDLTHDVVFGRAAILAYALACEDEEPALAADLRLEAFHMRNPARGSGGTAPVPGS